MFRDDEFVSVNPIEVSPVLLTQTLTALHLSRTKVMAPLALVSKLAVIMEEAQTKVELGAGGGELAGAVLLVASVVVKADLEGEAADMQSSSL